MRAGGRSWVPIAGARMLTARWEAVWNLRQTHRVGGTLAMIGAAGRAAVCGYKSMCRMQEAVMRCARRRRQKGAPLDWTQLRPCKYLTGIHGLTGLPATLRLIGVARHANDAALCGGAASTAHYTRQQPLPKRCARQTMQQTRLVSAQTALVHRLQCTRLTCTI